MNTLTITAPAIANTSRRAAPKRISFDRLAGIATTGALIVALLLALVAVVVPAATGGTALTVMTGSMTPNLPPGHIAVYYPVNADTLRAGNIIAYQPADNWTNGVPITHRVTAVESTVGHVTSITVKGDAKAAPDKPLQPSQVIGKMAYFVPFAGLLQVVGFHLSIDWIRQVLSASLLGYGGFLIIRDAVKKRRARSAAKPALTGEVPVHVGCHADRDQGPAITTRAGVRDQVATGVAKSGRTAVATANAAAAITTTR